ncbi:MAG TPA: hypothetical protein VLK65_31785 [Vicinamibacteria bacterium]|nr:hypothetical protein [Vicinamibacteria bacterium]
MSTKRKRHRSRPEITFELACARIEEILRGATRREIAAATLKSGRAQALSRLRRDIENNRFEAVSGQISLERIVHKLDERTRQDGFHVLHDWDGKADRLNSNTIPVDVVTFLIDSPDPPHSDETVVSIALDYYLLYVLGLLSLRVWDEGNPNDNLDRVTRLLRELQGPDGSGQRFVDNAETLILIATSHFEPDHRAYDRLLERLKAVDHSRRVRLALAHSAILASHLRFGFEATYGRDVLAMRNDNVPDYPWLCFALVTLMNAFSRARDEGGVGLYRDRLVEGILNGLSPDARAFLGTAPESLSAHARELSELRHLFLEHGPVLLEEFERHRPSNRAYSPFSFYFNFAHNVLKAIVVDALLRAKASNLTLNDLLTGVSEDDALDARKQTLARTLMAYGRSSPDTIRGRLVPAIVYDPRSGRLAFGHTIRRLREQTSR